MEKNGLDRGASRGHHRGMGLLALPVRGDVFLDERGTSRALRVSWHHDDADGGTVVLSLWRGPVCSGSFRLRREDVPALIASLAQGLSEPAELPAPRVPGREDTPLAG
jgi:hypothetical protein